MKKSQQLLRFFMLVSGLLLILSVVIPHHHHEDGMACVHINSADSHDEHAENDAHHHAGCDCSGHTIVFNSTILPGHSSGQDAVLLSMPLFTLMDYVHPHQILLTSSFYSDKATYIDTLRDVWVPAATGLRAPPAVIG